MKDTACTTPMEGSLEKRTSLLESVYKEEASGLIKKLTVLLEAFRGSRKGASKGKTFSAEDVILITYADMIKSVEQMPLVVLHKFSEKYFKGAINYVHLLPFFPYTSDDGFSVSDYDAVNPACGNWEAVENMSRDFRLMFDLVLNHCSSKHQWFHEFLKGNETYEAYFHHYEAIPEHAKVVRPRKSPLFSKYDTANGTRYVWATFSADQIDVNWANPDVFLEFVKILLLYVEKGAQIVRLDAIPFLWKEQGTACWQLPEVHTMVKILRNILAYVAPEVVVLTESNIPHQENISYFGDGDEAQMVYNFSLPPLVLHALLKQNAQYLTDWAQGLGAFPDGCHFLNFTASHDGIGVTPLNGLVPPAEVDYLVQEVRNRGGDCSMKQSPEGEIPYELNIALYDALRVEGDDDLSSRRFLCSQLIALAFKGVPAIYFHSLMATRNNTKGVEATGAARTINRYKWEEQELEALIGDPGTLHGRIFKKYLSILRRRKTCSAFDPNASQVVHDFGPSLFVIQRTNHKTRQSVVCLFNVTHTVQAIDQEQVQALVESADTHYDVLSGEAFGHEVPSDLMPYATRWLANGR